MTRPYEVLGNNQFGDVDLIEAAYFPVESPEQFSVSSLPLSARWGSEIEARGAIGGVMVRLDKKVCDFLGKYFCGVYENASLLAAVLSIVSSPTLEA